MNERGPLERQVHSEDKGAATLQDLGKGEVLERDGEVALKEEES